MQSFVFILVLLSFGKHRIFHSENVLFASQKNKKFNLINLDLTKAMKQLSTSNSMEKVYFESYISIYYKIFN